MRGNCCVWLVPQAIDGFMAKQQATCFTNRVCFLPTACVEASVQVVSVVTKSATAIEASNGFRARERILLLWYCNFPRHQPQHGAASETRLPDCD